MSNDKVNESGEVEEAIDPPTGGTGGGGEVAGEGVGVEEDAIDPTGDNTGGGG